MLLPEPTFVILAKAGIQENKGFPAPGFQRGDLESTTSEPEKAFQDLQPLKKGNF
ncbi:hypothetical protein DSTSK_21460 [Desulforhabdus sp. TSK]|nr:hypothetical protein DSTSK_21460 [Desulforhabdus sp. TSK]